MWWLCSIPAGMLALLPTYLKKFKMNNQPAATVTVPASQHKQGDHGTVAVALQQLLPHS